MKRRQKSVPNFRDLVGRNGQLFSPLLGVVPGKLNLILSRLESGQQGGSFFAGVFAVKEDGGAGRFGV